MTLSANVPLRKSVLLFMAAPAVVIFVSSNLVNVGNLAFNMIFSRLMGPELFGVLALLLTIKLAVLGISSALQMAVSQHVATTRTHSINATMQALSRVNQTVLLVLIGLAASTILVLTTTGGLIDTRLGLPKHAFFLLLIAFPFGVSLSLLRGIVFGDMDVRRIVLSANVEMWVRLIGALFAWQLGWGLNGVVFAISLSIVAGWIVISDVLPKISTHINAANVVKPIAIAALPFGILQLAQVLALDGEIFAAHSFLESKEAGLVASLSLFQRIQFFSCLALAMVLLPSVSSAFVRKQNVYLAALPVGALFLATTLPLICASIFMPEKIISLLAGEAYKSAAPDLWLAAVASALFTFNYLFATFLIAIGKAKFVLIMIGMAVLQLCLIFAWPSDISQILTVKIYCQLVCTLFLAVSLMSIQVIKK